MKTLTGYWEESFDGATNTGYFVVGSYLGNEEYLEEEDPAYQLVGMWNGMDIINLKSQANELGFKIYDENSGSFL